MAQIGALPIPNSPAPMMGQATPNLPAVTQPNVVAMPVMRATPLAAVIQQEQEAEARQAAPMITGLAGHIRSRFSVARDAKRMYIEPRMLRAMRNRRSEYDPEKLAAIRAMGGSEVFAGITGQKCRAAASWVRDVVMETGEGRPWSIRPTPVPELPPQINELIVQQATQQLAAAMQSGVEPDAMQTVSMVSMMRDQAMAAVREEAQKRAERMADKMEDQLVEGGFIQALDMFINDLVTFPAAIMKGPVVRKRPHLQWSPQGQPVVQDKLTLEWERVSPFDIYPSPQATNIDDGDLIEKHQLSRGDLQAMKGVQGYDDAAIDLVLRDFSSGLSSWMFDTNEQADAEGRPTGLIISNPDGLIDALQYWGSVQGQMLLDWGMDDGEVDDPLAEYQVEAWLIGPYVIKAVLNPDPLNRRPYYKCSYEDVPGSFWGNSIPDLVSDPQDIMNAAARAMVNNAALASGPQVGVLTDRIAPGESITQMQPWKVWQFVSDPMHGTAEPPIQFFQPTSVLNELMALFEKFSVLADEYSGIPRYMTGDARTGGAGRTASGLSMLMTNAGKSIKSVITNIDLGLYEPVLQRLYYYNMRYMTDPELKGDVCIVARGAANIEAKEAAQVRRNEFLATTANPIDVQIVGVEGRAAILREVAKGLDMDVDKVVPSVEMLRQRMLAKQALATQDPGTAPGPGSQENNEQKLQDGSPINDNFNGG